MTKKITSEQVTEAKQLLTVLQEKFPNAFFSDSVKIRPLKINIHRDVHTLLVDNYSKKQVCRTLHLYISHPDYRKKLMINAQRIDLEGSVCGVVTEEHVLIAEEAKQRRQRRQIRLQAAAEKAQQRVEKRGFSPPSPVSLLGRPTLSLKRINGENGISHPETHLKENIMSQVTEHQHSTIDTPVVAGDLEVNVKIHALPSEVQTVKNGWQQFIVEADGQMVLVKIRPKIWKKMQQANENYPAWVASITGKIGRRIKNGFELLQPAVQIFERKAKESENAAVCAANQSSEYMHVSLS